MAIVEPLKPPRTDDPKEQKKFLEALALSASYLTASGDPTGSVAPRWYGDRYYDAVAKAWYWASGLTSADWATVEVTFDPAADIADFGITASKLWLSVPVVLGLTLTNNSPTAGKVAWSEFDLYLNGVKYDIASGNSDKKYIYFKDLSSTLAESDTNPSSLSDWAPQEDFVIAVNLSGTGQQAWSGIANQVIGNAFIESLSGTKIQATTSVAIGNSTYGTDGIQLEYNSGDPRFYAGNGAAGASARHIKFDGTTVDIAGALTLTGSSSGYTNFSDRPADSTVLNAYNQSGPNLCPNAAFEGAASANPGYGWTFGYNYVTCTVSSDLASYTLDVGLNKGSTIYIYQGARNGTGGANGYVYSPKIPVTVGSRYCVSAYVGAHRATISVWANYYNSSDSNIGNSAISSTAQNTPAEYLGGGTVISGYKRCYDFFTAPANTAYVRVYIVKDDTAVGASPDDSYAFITRAALQEVGASQTVVPPWAFCDASLLSGGYVRTELLSATNIQTGTLDASKATVTNLSASNITAGSLSVDRIAAGTITAAKIVTGDLTYTQLAGGAVTTTAKTSGTSSCTTSVTKVGGDNILLIVRGMGYAGTWAGSEGASYCSPASITINLYRGSNSSGTLLATSEVGLACVDGEAMIAYIDTPTGTGSQAYFANMTVTGSLKLNIVNLRR
jgi:hypothetical protein